MLKKKELLEGLELLYTGKAFKGFREENPFVTFMGYDHSSWWKIRVRYGRRIILTSIRDVMLKRELQPEI